MVPEVLSMEVDDDDDFESYYRLRIGKQVKYLTVSPGTFDRDTLSWPIGSLPSLPYNETWTVANLSRDKTSGELQYSTHDQPMAGVNNQWHQVNVDCLSLEKTKQLTAMALEAVSHSLPTSPDNAQTKFVAKIARFEWEVPRIEQETRAYQLLEGTGLAPRFLGHIHENGRVMGFLLEKLEGRSAYFEDLGQCEEAVRSLHRLGLLHGDVNRYNFLITDEGVKLIDFESSNENASPESMQKELEKIRTNLTDESGRGGGFMFSGDED